MTNNDLLSFVQGRKFATIYADPPWRFQNRTGKVAPEHHRLNRYPTMDFEEIKSLPVPSLAEDTAHLYLWVPNALLPDGLEVMSAWGFEYKTNLIWEKVRKDGFPDGRGVGFYFRNVTEIPVSYTHLSSGVATSNPSSCAIRTRRATSSPLFALTPRLYWRLSSNPVRGCPPMTIAITFKGS